MRRITLLAPGIFLLPMLTISIQAKGWRGIVPLHSTKADVISRLGRPNLDGNRYELTNERATIIYSDGPCVADRWNMPKDTVIAIMTEPNDNITLSDLHLNLSRYIKRQDHEVLDAYHYTNDSEGLEIAVVDGFVSYIYYTPTAKDAY